ncbi:hypothetical protein EDB87DRAFT_528933 [Lactarius vividus]|nr:hypothetical protein EDB87DRAFT_528933 [Lactarius vividus]
MWSSWWVLHRIIRAIASWIVGHRASGCLLDVQDVYQELIITRLVCCSLKIPDRDGGEVPSELPEDADASYQESVLNLYRSDNTALRDKLIKRLLSDRKLQAIASPLHAILASSASNEAISEELSDMMGYDELDMIVEILENRSLVTAEKQL